MRFLDLFMAAIGALAFLAMLFAWLTANMPHEGAWQPPSSEARHPENLRLLTRQLPRARAAEDYQQAFAYRGGAGRISWRLVAGEWEIPEGMVFDTKLGILSGKPKKPGVASFVLQVSDETKATDTHAYELMVDPPNQAGRRLENFFAAALLVFTALLWLMAMAALRISRHALKAMMAAREQGYAKVQRHGGRGVTEVIDINDGGIETKQTDIRRLRQFSAALGFAAVANGFYLIWRIWLA